MTSDNSKALWFKKFIVNRVDQRDKPGGDREGADYLVIDLKHDEHAIQMVRKYAELKPNLRNSLHLMALRRYGHAYLEWAENPAIAVVAFCKTSAHVVKETCEWSVYKIKARRSYVQREGQATSVAEAKDAVLRAFEEMLSGR